MGGKTVQVSNNNFALEKLEIGYFELIKNNPTYARFWLSFLISWANQYVF